MMKLTLQRVFEATQALAAIINENRPLPSKGKYRVARMHAKLFPEFTTLNDRRTAMIMAYGHKQAVLHGKVVTEPDDLTHAGIVMQDAVPDDKMPEFLAAWADLAKEEIEVNVEPIPIYQLCIDGQEGVVTFAEFAALGELVTGD